ncbi:POK19 protein, partial [Centropus unirufus]|nr:POK19 protein [Centropus unirufus]
RHIQKPLCSAFVVLGVPKEIKTDNSPGYRSKATAKFLLQWGVQHVTGIPFFACRTGHCRAHT